MKVLYGWDIDPVDCAENVNQQDLFYLKNYFNHF